ncbi:hypothetical protein Naga_100014g45 [Nannochloropsis gaditana]|uniref:Uncharacterized protein n=1 Tax=Nannochloropsis gaditana TaxID=72520 RepID=W7TZM0_9STRA|nr:hypothetical protein Naga_100014g45 [Nannochloropsis gaditana]
MRTHIADGEPFPYSFPSPSRKRQIPHEDRDILEIKRRMGGLRFGEELPDLGSSLQPPIDVNLTPLHGSPDSVFGSSGGPGVPPPVPGPNCAGKSTAPHGFPQTPSIDEGATEMDSEESEGDDEVAGVLNGRSDTRSRFSGHEKDLAKDAFRRGTQDVSRIDEDDPRATMLNILYKRRPPRDKVEEKIENLIRRSMLRATPGGPAAPPLSQCDAPWPVTESQRMDGSGSSASSHFLPKNDDGGGDMDM